MLNECLIFQVHCVYLAKVKAISTFRSTVCQVRDTAYYVKVYLVHTDLVDEKFPTTEINFADYDS